MTRRTCAVLAALTLAGCVGVERLGEPYGDDAYALSCGALPACARTAARLCPAGYDEIDPDIMTRIFANMTTVGEGVRSVGYLLTFRQPEGDRVMYVSCTTGEGLAAE